MYIEYESVDKLYWCNIQYWKFFRKSKIDLTTKANYVFENHENFSIMGANGYINAHVYRAAEPFIKYIVQLFVICSILNIRDQDIAPLFCPKFQKSKKKKKN